VRIVGGGLKKKNEHSSHSFSVTLLILGFRLFFILLQINKLKYLSALTLDRVDRICKALVY